jgi:hypothetical protein
MGIEMKLIRQFAMGMLRDFVADLLEVFLDGQRFGRVGESLRFLEGSEEGIASADLVFGGKLGLGLRERESGWDSKKASTRAAGFRNFN